MKKIPDGYHSITPYLVVNREQKQSSTIKKYIRMMTPNRKRTAHAKIEIGNSELMLAAEFPEMNSLSP